MNEAEANFEPPLVSTRAWCRTWSKAQVAFGRGNGWLWRKTAWRRLRYRLGRSIVAMAIVLAGFAKLAYVDGIPMPAASVGAAAVCMALCLYDYINNGGAEKKGKKK